MWLYCSLNILSSQGRVVKSFPHVDSCALSSVAFVNNNEVFSIEFSKLNVENYLNSLLNTDLDWESNRDYKCIRYEKYGE